MDAVDRSTQWGKTIYAMMLLACVYGLRVSDIRGLQLKSLHWKEKTVSTSSAHIFKCFMSDQMYGFVDLILECPSIDAISLTAVSSPSRFVARLISGDSSLSPYIGRKKRSAFTR